MVVENRHRNLEEDADHRQGHSVHGSETRSSGCRVNAPVVAECPQRFLHYPQSAGRVEVGASLVQSFDQHAPCSPKRFLIGLHEVRELDSHRRDVWSIRSEFDREVDHGIHRVIRRQVI
jgi:hypothetical protein